MKSSSYFAHLCCLILLLLSNGYSQEPEKLKRLNAAVTKAFQEGRYQQGLTLAKKAYRLGVSHFGKNHPATIESMNNLGGLYYSQGNYAKAEPILLQALQLRKQVLGENHPETLSSMHNLAALYSVQENYAKAKPLCLQILKASKQVLGAHHPDTLSSMQNLAALYYGQREYAKAETLYLKTLQLRKQVLGAQHSLTLQTMAHLAALYKSQGKYAKAEPMFLQTLKLQKQVLHPNHPDVLQSMNHLAALYHLQEKHAKAGALYRETLEKSKQVLGANHPFIIMAAGNLASVYQSQGNYPKAEQLYLQALEQSKRIYGSHHSSTITCMSNLANLYHDRGKYSQSEQLYLQVLALQKKVMGANHSTTFLALHNLANLYTSQGKYAKAEPLLLQAVELQKQAFGANHRETIIFTANLAGLYKAQGNYAKAEPIYLQALERSQQVLGANHPQTIAIINNLGTLYATKGAYTKAEPLFLKAFQLRKQILGENHPETIESMNNLAALYTSLENYTKAEPMYLKALELSEQVLGMDHPATILAMNTLAVFYDSQGNYAKAETLYIKMTELSKQVLGPHHPETLLSMNHVAGVYNSQGKHGKALHIIQESLQKKYLFLVRELQGSSEKTRLKILEKFHFATERKFLFSTLENYPKKDHNSLALYYLANYKGILLRISQELKQIFVGSKNQELLKQLAQKRSEYSQLSLNSHTRRNNPSLQKKLEGEIEQLEKQLIWKNSHAKSLLSDTKPSEILQSLHKDLLLDFVVYQSLNDDQEKLAVVLASAEKIERVVLGDLQPLASLVQEYRKKLQQQQPVKELAKKIYQQIFVPLAEHLVEKNKIYIVPDGILHLLPFHSLVNQQGEYFAQSQNLVILSSSTDLIWQKNTSNSNVAAIFAYPDYGKGKGKSISQQNNIHFLPLPGTEQEAQDLAKTLDIPTQIYSQKQASEKNISQLKSPAVLHIATHGYFLAPPEPSNSRQKNHRGVTFSDATFAANNLPIAQPKIMTITPSKEAPATEQLVNPLVYSGLALASANHPQGDGILTALEVLGLHLHGTQLVVLSACETGVGEIRQGEGVYSLQRAFREAGAETVVASLWKVDDQATRIFMKRFYQRYIKGSSAQKAARDTQLEFINSKRYSHPYYWSSFIVIGGNSDDLVLSKRVDETKPTQQSDPNRSGILPIVFVGGMALIGGVVVWWLRKKQQRIVQERMARQARRLKRKRQHPSR